MKTIPTTAFLSRDGSSIMKLMNGLNYHLIVKNLIEQGSIGMIVGPSKSKKSMLAYNLCLALLSGLPFLNQKTQSPKIGKGDEVLGKHKVLYIDLEMTDLAITTRLRAMNSYYKAPLENISYLTSADICDVSIMDMQKKTANTTFFDNLIEEIKRIEATVVVIDCLYMIVSDENDNTLMTSALKQFQRVRNLTGAAVVIVHHTKKDRPDYSEPFQCGRGASSIGGFLEWVLAIEPVNSLEAKIHHGSRNLKSLDTINVKFDESHLVWREQQEEGPDEILDSIFESDSELLIDEYLDRASKIGYHRNSAENLIEAATKYERIKPHRGQKACVRLKVNKHTRNLMTPTEY